MISERPERSRDVLGSRQVPPRQARGVLGPQRDSLFWRLAAGRLGGLRSRRPGARCGAVPPPPPPTMEPTAELLFYVNGRKVSARGRSWVGGGFAPARSSAPTRQVRRCFPDRPGARGPLAGVPFLFLPRLPD